MSRPRVGAVSYLNTKPLIHGLERFVDLDLAVPSALLSGLAEGRTDVALLPTADLLKLDGATPIPVGGICCDGPTLTVRIFSDRPLERLETLRVDTDSHTSVQLARVILARRYGCSPKFLPLDRGAPVDSPTLLIGDKVITSAPDDARFPVQHDLGAEWKALTGLPFVFAIWTARPGYDASDVGPVLGRALDEGLAHVEEIVAHFSPIHRWPSEVARKYLTEYLHFRVGPRELEAVRRFHAEIRAL
jgi:chorismate dehydratase